MRAYSKLAIICLTEEQKSRTCGYWYKLESSFMSYKAFGSREALIRFLEVTGMDVDVNEIPEPGTWKLVPVWGEIVEKSLNNQEQLNQTPGIVGRWLDNGEYTMCIFNTRPGDDNTPPRCTVSYVNVNSPRQTFPYFESDALYCGRVSQDDAPELDRRLEEVKRTGYIPL